MLIVLHSAQCLLLYDSFALKVLDGNILENPFISKSTDEIYEYNESSQINIVKRIKCDSAREINTLDMIFLL